MRDAFRLVDKNAQNTGAAAAQQLDIDDFEALVGADPFRDFPHFFYDGRPGPPCFVSRCKRPASNKKVGFRPLPLLVPRT